MSTKVLPVVALGMLILAALLALWTALPTAALAQCGDIKSSCYSCHQEIHPVCGKTEWHSVYGHRYACWNCHGGNDTARDKELAHVGLVLHPLEDTYTSCYACHAEGYQQLAERFAKEIGVTVSSREPLPRSDTPSASVAVQPTLSPSASTLAVPSNSSDWQWVWWLFPLIVLLALIWYVWKRSTL
jgi:hypothetical protein